jgi:hypothetical protein
MKKIVLLFAFFCSGLGFSQSINDYKYVIVPEKFDFLKEPNKFNLNTLTKMVFEKYGFEVYFTNDNKPDELALDRCKALYGDIISESNMLTTALILTLKDCQGRVVFTSEKGRSKEKNYQKAYYEALREASASFASLNYRYTPTAPKNGVAVIQEKPTPAAAQAPSQLTAPVPVTNENVLFAQPITNGYQLVDSTPKVVLRIFKTSQQDSYTGVSDTKNGVVFKRGNEWFFEYYQNDKLMSEKLNIKF